MFKSAKPKGGKSLFCNLIELHRKTFWEITLEIWTHCNVEAKVFIHAKHFIQAKHSILNLNVLFEANSIWSKFYLKQILFEANSIWSKFYLKQILFEANSIWSKFYLKQILFEAKYYIQANILFKLNILCCSCENDNCAK